MYVDDEVDDAVIFSYAGNQTAIAYFVRVIEREGDTFISVGVISYIPSLRCCSSVVLTACVF